MGRGWHQAKWRPPPSPSVQGYPTHEKLSQAVPDHPVMLTHGTGHMCLANAKAMELAGVDRNTESPQGGEILRPIECFYASVTRKLADVVVLSKDVLTVPADEILGAQVLYTIVGGKVLYRKKPSVAGDPCLAHRRLRLRPALSPGRQE